MANKTSAALATCQVLSSDAGRLRFDASLLQHAAELQLQPHIWLAAFLTVKSHLISAYSVTILGKPLESGFTFLDKLAETRGLAYWAHRISFAVIACILLHDLTLLVLLPLFQRLSQLISRAIIHVASTITRAESTSKELPATALHDTDRKSFQKLSFGQIDDITQMSRLKDREDMIFIREYRILPRGSKWTKEFWTVKEDREWQLDVALAAGDVVQFGRRSARPKREGVNPEL